MIRSIVPSTFAVTPRSLSAAAAPLSAPVLGPVERFVPSGTAAIAPHLGSDKLKGILVMGALGLAGAGLGVYAGLATGVLAGVAGAVAGASGGALAAAKLPGEHIKAGAILGMLTGAIVGASVSSPFAAVALGISGATAPVGLMLAIFSGAS